MTLQSRRHSSLQVLKDASVGFSWQCQPCNLKKVRSQSVRLLLYIIDVRVMSMKAKKILKARQLLAAVCWLGFICLSVSFTISFLHNYTHLEFMSTWMTKNDFSMIAVCPEMIYKLEIVKEILNLKTEGQDSWSLMAQLTDRYQDPEKFKRHVQKISFRGSEMIESIDIELAYNVKETYSINLTDEGYAMMESECAVLWLTH